MRYLSERGKVVPLLTVGNHGGGGNTASLYVGNAHHVTFIVVVGTHTASTDGTAQVLVRSGTAAATFGSNYLKPDVFRSTGDIGASAADTLTAVDYVSGQDYFLAPVNDNRVVIIELDVNTVAAGDSWVRLQFGEQSTALNASVVAIVYPRYKPAGTMVLTT